MRWNPARVSSISCFVVAIALAGCGTADAVDRPIVRTDSGLQYVVMEEGVGAPAVWGDTVVVHESTSKEDGTLIFSTWTSGQPITFALGADQVVDGMEELVAGMRPGERRHAVMPPAITKRQRYPAMFGPADTLLFEVVLIRVEAEAQKLGP